MASKYSCPCGKTALYGEAHICSLNDEHYTTYLSNNGQPYFLTPFKFDNWFWRMLIKLFAKKEEPQKLKFVLEGGWGALSKQTIDDITNYSTEQQEDIRRFADGIECQMCEMPVLRFPSATMHYVGCGRAKRIWGL